MSVYCRKLQTTDKLKAFLKNNHRSFYTKMSFWLIPCRLFFLCTQIQFLFKNNSGLPGVSHVPTSRFAAASAVLYV